MFIEILDKLAKGLNTDLALLKEKHIALGVEDLALACADFTFIDPDWALLAGRVIAWDLQQRTAASFSEATELMKVLLNEDYYNFVMDHSEQLNCLIDAGRDFRFDLFAICTLTKSYLAQVKGEHNLIVETPQYMYLRVAVYLWFNTFKEGHAFHTSTNPDLHLALTEIKKVYDMLSLGRASHASPTMFNAGMKRSQLASCYLLDIQDNMLSITKSWTDCALISMNSGGIGCNYSKLRHSEIGFHGKSKGVVSWLKIKNEVLAGVDQAGRRKGSGSMFLRDCHMDIFEFSELKEGEGPEGMRARDLFYAIMVSDLFMRRVEKDEMWSLFCPNKAKGLFELWGTTFESAYVNFEKSGIADKKIRARELWQHILRQQIKTGLPFIVYMDAINDKSNQKHSGVIHNSNLCVEIAEVTSEKEIASCTLASISLGECVKVTGDTKYFDFTALEEITRQLVRNLNQVIDRNFYHLSIPEIPYSNFRHRPIGVGIQGLADALARLDLSWVEPVENYSSADAWEGSLKMSKAAGELNHQIFETIYYAALKESLALAKIHGAYETFSGSPLSQGLFQFDLWAPSKRNYQSRITDNEWSSLRSEIMRFGTRNSLLVALMPTASSAHILGNAESFEPFNEYIYARTVLSGQFTIVNRHLVNDLKEIGMWNGDTVTNIMANHGSIGNLSTATQRKRLNYLKLKYRTIYEIPQKVLVEMSADRGRFVCQTQSFNCHMVKPTFTKLNAYHFYAWQEGLKTGMYYLRQLAGATPINFTLTSSTEIKCNDEICTSCQA